MADYKQLCAELAESVELLLEMRSVKAKPLKITEDRLNRAHAALAEPEPDGSPVWTEGICGDNAALLRDGVMVPIEEVVQELNEGAQARAVLARWGNHPGSPDSSMPQPAAGEVAGVAKWLHKRGRLADLGTRDWYFCAAELLERLSPPQPIPVTESLPGPEDCDAKGRCWLFRLGQDGVGDWFQRAPYPSADAYQFFCVTHWLPGRALPQPF